MNPKICMIGGGSYGWSPKLVRDILVAPPLQEAEFRLLDLDLNAARTIAAVGKRYCREWRLDATFRALKNADRALDGADFVVITISTGGLDAMAHDLRIPERYSIFQTVGDTVGPGGWSRSLRNIPVFADLGRKIAKRCPRAFVLNYTNPMAALTKTLTLVTSQPIVGLCHGVFENYRHLADVFGLERPEDICARYAGVNHFFWMLDFAVRGEPGYPLLRRKLRGGRTLDGLIRESHADEAGHRSLRRLVSSEMFETLGYLPYLGDRHICEFVGRYATDRKRLAAYALHRTTIAERRRALLRNKRRAEALAAGKAPLESQRSRETAADIMAARVERREFVDVMNLPNVGQVANLPMGAVVETAGVVNATGFAPVMAGALPPQLLNLTIPHAVNQERIVEAGMEGDRGKALQALIADPLCAHLPVPRVRKMADELLRANRPLLPQFFGTKKHR